jgi:CelD/BcsL family acetyltransferase involved in cellulose biosynthesis
MEAARLSDRLTVAEVRDRAELASLETEWNALVSATRDEIFYRHEFIRIWIDNFAPGTQLRILTARDEAGALCAVLPLMEEQSTLYGAPVTQLVSTSNPHSCRFDLIARDGQAAASAFLAHLRADPGWDLLRITDVPEGGNAWHLHEAVKQAGLPCGTWESLQSPFVPLPAKHDELLARLDAKFRANVRRRRRKLEEKGKVTLERVAGGLHLEGWLEHGYALEQSGWKGKRGTAIAQDGATRGFYSELAREAAELGKLSLYFLCVAGRPVAFQYGLTYGGRYLLLKPGYDEALKECSPGQLLMDEVLRDCTSRGLAELDFLGPDMPWKRDWTDKVRVHTWMFAFRDSVLGRALCAAKFRWLPAAKEAMARWKQ